MMKMYYVYNIISPKGKFYVGYTSLKPEKRFEKHIKNSRQTKRRCPAIENAIRKYGPNKMIFIVVRSCLTEEEALRYEGLYTKFFKTTDKKYGYNVRDGGRGGGSGYTFQHTEEAKKAISMANAGTKKSDEELKQRQEKRWENTVIKYANIGIDISKDNLDKIITEYPTAYKAAKYLTCHCPEQFVAIRSILRTYLKSLPEELLCDIYQKPLFG